MERKIFTARAKSGRDWRIEVSGDKDDAHFHAYGIVPKDATKVIDAKECSGMRNSFGQLCLLAKILTGNDGDDA